MHLVYNLNFFFFFFFVKFRNLVPHGNSDGNWGKQNPYRKRSTLDVAGVLQGCCICFSESAYIRYIKSNGIYIFYDGSSLYITLWRKRMAVLSGKNIIFFIDKPFWLMFLRNSIINSLKKQDPPLSDSQMSSMRSSTWRWL